MLSAVMYENDLFLSQIEESRRELLANSEMRSGLGLTTLLAMIESTRCRWAMPTQMSFMLAPQLESMM